MGRTPLIIFILLLLTFSKVYALDFDYNCDRNFNNYYFGGEYLYFTCTITPHSSSDAKLADGQEYTVYTQLDSSAVIVIVEYKDGKKVLYPSPSDEYISDDNGTRLKFYVPESDDGIDWMKITVYGYIPVVDYRLKNVTVLGVLGKDELIDSETAVVNKQKFYSDLKKFEKAECVDEKKLMEAKLLYNDGKYTKAEEYLRDIEDAVNKCYYSSKKADYESRVSDLKNELTDISKDLFLVQYMLENEGDRIKNYEDVFSQWQNLSQKKKEIEDRIDRVERLILQGRFSTAGNEIDSIEKSLTSLKAGVEVLKDSIKEKSSPEIDWITLAMLGGVIALAVIAVVVFVSTRRRDKW
ncbi:hypothetical protein [Archaeoglobus neptunius]|uniref:hypothetical protein n=1 Tax=Archaeoglobus neptunius TaxID=2798580 RepID=UPI0019268C15|nr:hypothetical protein [Archaeoglobus neptunius]